MVLKTKAADRGAAGHFDDRRMELIMGRLLQFGVTLASLVMLAGGILYVKVHHGSAPDYRVFESQPETLRHVGGVLKGIEAREPAAIIQLALLLLIATPVARVAFALVAFFVEKDKLYIVISAMVLAVLLYGFFRSQ